MTDTPIDRESVKQALAELGDVVRCRCHEAYRGRGLHDPDCQCDSAEAVATVRAALDAAQEQIAAMEEGMPAVHMAGYMEGKKAAEAEIKRLRDGLVELRDDPILHRKTAYMRRRAAVILKENPDG